MPAFQTTFTTLRSLLEALAKAMNLINPDMENHHQQTAYIAMFLSSLMGFDEEAIHAIIIASLLHDAGSIVNDEPVTRKELASQSKAYALAGARMLRGLDEFTQIADIIQRCQSSWQDLEAEVNAGFVGVKTAQMASVVHMADTMASCLREDEHVLPQVAKVQQTVRQLRGSELNPDAVDTFLQWDAPEFFWMDVMHNPSFLLYFTGDMHQLSLQKAASLTRLMSRIIDYRSPFTAMHSAGVAAVARELARLAGMSEEDCIKMEIAGNLHDVGKLAVPRTILEKPGRLTEREFDIIKEHAYYTRLILLEVQGFAQIADWAGFHHEKLSGKGYPFRYSAAQLDTGSRLMAVADIFSAVSERRPYRGELGKDKVIAILQENVASGGISGDCVDLLVSSFDAVNQIRDDVSRSAGKNYYESLGQAVPIQ